MRSLLRRLTGRSYGASKQVALWLDGGMARMEGPGDEVVGAYLEAMDAVEAPSAMEDF